MKKKIRFLRAYPLATLSLFLILLFFLAAIFAPLVAPYGLTETDYSEPYAAPSQAHWFGTDELSRDVFSRILFALRISLFIGIVPTTINLMLGTVLGMISGLSGKYTDSFLMRLSDIALSYPFMILAMAIVYNLGPGTMTMLLTLTLVGWASTARIIRAETKSLANTTFVQAARSMGASKWELMCRHILPNVKATLLVLYTMNIPFAILSEAGLSFLGFGAQPPQTSLGVMVAKGRRMLFDAPWVSIAPGIFILLLSFSFHFLGDSLRDWNERKQEELGS